VKIRETPAVFQGVCCIMLFPLVAALIDLMFELHWFGRYDLWFIAGTFLFVFAVFCFFLPVLGKIQASEEMFKDDQEP
jgi:hypothetical protein